MHVASSKLNKEGPYATDGSCSSSDGSESDDGSSSSCCTDDWMDWGVIPRGACGEVLSAATEVLSTVLLLYPVNPEQRQQQQQQLAQLPVLLLCTSVAGLRVFEAQALRLVDAAVSILAQLFGNNDYDPPSNPSCA
jgi:hypothetical protein